MKATFNAVGEVLDMSADAYIAYTKAITARLAGVLRKVTPALEEITEAIENSSLPTSVKRLKGIEAEMQAAVAEYMPGIMEASAPLQAAQEKLAKRWKELTRTDSEKAAESDRQTVDSDRTFVKDLDTAARKLPHGSPVRERARDLAGNLGDVLDDRPLTQEEHAARAAMLSDVITELGRVKLADEHGEMVEALYRKASAVTTNHVLYLDASRLAMDLRSTCAQYHADEDKRRPLNDDELAKLAAMDKRIDEYNVYVQTKYHAGDDRVALHRKY